MQQYCTLPYSDRIIDMDVLVNVFSPPLILGDVSFEGMTFFENASLLSPFCQENIDYDGRATGAFILISYGRSA